MMLPVKTVEKEFMELYVMKLPCDGFPEVDPREAYVIPVMERDGGILLALPVTFLPQEWVQLGQSGDAEAIFGPSIETKVQAMEEDEAGQEVPLDIEIPCLLMDFNLSVLPALRPYDPVTEGEGILCFLEGSPHILPFSSSLLSMAYSWMVKEGVPPRVQFYSAEEEQGKQSFVAAKPKKKVDPPSKPKKPTTANLAEQLQQLSETIPLMANQLKTLQEQQTKFETAVIAGQEALRTPAHRQAFSTPIRNPSDLKGFMKDLGPPPRTKDLLPSPLQAAQKEKEIRLEEDEPMDPREVVAPSGQDPSIGMALMQQSQAMNALVAHLIGQQDPMLDLGSSSAGGLSLSSKGTRGRERLLQELSAKNGTFFLQVAQNAFKRLRPAEAVPRSLQEFPKKAIFSKYLERQGGFASQKDIGITLWLLSQVADALLCQEPVHAQDLLALAIVSLEQVAQDGGKWELGYLLSLQEDPPQSLFSSRAPSTNPRLRAFAPLCPQPWTSVALTYLREMDIIATRRSEAASSSKSAVANPTEEPRPNPKRKPKFPKKPKEKEGS